MVDQTNLSTTRTGTETSGHIADHNTLAKAANQITADYDALKARVTAAEAKLASLTANIGTTAPTGGTALPSLANLWKAPQQVDNYVKGQPELAPIAAQPQAKWLLGTETQAQVSTLASSAAGKTMLLCIYAIPGRDNGQYSAGGLASASAYLAYIKTVIAGLGTAPAIVVVEPDALGFASQMTGTTRTDRLSLISQTLALFGAVPTIDCYADIATWATDPAAVLKSAGVAAVDGFSINVSGFNAQSDCYTFGDNLVTSLNGLSVSGKKYVIDSSRNGAGALTTSFPGSAPWFAINQPWCNPPGRRTGLNPGTVDAVHPNCFANLWVKSPGETDGSFPALSQSAYYGASAPAAGTFWSPSARDLLGLTPYVQGTPATGTTFSSAKAAAFVNKSTGASTVNGRYRINLTSGYESVNTNPAWSLVGGQVSLRVYAAAAPSSATVAETSVQIESPTAGTRVRAVVDTKAGTIKFASEVGYYDEGAVSIAYSATSMAYQRIRETGGKVYFDTSPNKTTWTNRRTIATPAWAHAAADQTCTLTTHADITIAGVYAEFDEINTDVATVAALSSISDTFATQNSTLWNYLGLGSGGRIASGTLELDASPANPTLTTVNSYSMAGTGIYAKLVQLPNISNGSCEAEMRLTDSSTGYYLGYLWAGTSTPGGATFRYKGSAAGFNDTYGAWNTTNPWMRIRNDGTDIVWENATAPIGPWYEQRRLAKPAEFNLASVQVSFRAGNYNNATTPGAARFDAFNTAFEQVNQINYTTDAATGAAVVSTYGAGHNAYGSAQDTSKHGLYDTANVLTAHDGYLDWYVRTISGTPRVAAPLPFNRPSNLIYGRWTVRARVPAAIPGYKIAFLLWPDTEVWNDGEIDFPETVYGLGTTSVKPTASVHQHDTYNGSTLTQDSTLYNVYSPSTLTDWHTYVIEWVPDYVRFLVDGVEMARTSSTNFVPRKAMHYVMQVETSIESSPGVAAAVPDASVTGHVFVSSVTQEKYLP